MIEDFIKLTVSVTQKNIDEGGCGAAFCPIACALVDMGYINPICGTSYIRVTDPKTGIRWRGWTPHEAEHFMKAYDWDWVTGREPFTFEIIMMPDRSEDNG